MIDYDALGPLVDRLPAGQGAMRWRPVMDCLIDLWVVDYERTMRGPDLVETNDAGFSYLFDISAGRLVAAWGVSAGRNPEKRDATRMAGHPLSAGPLYHRGHAIPHTLGGQTDINLVPQLAKINIGPFRPLERRAVSTPGSLYFTYWRYRRTLGAKLASQTPAGVDQGLLVRGEKPSIARHGN